MKSTTFRLAPSVLENEMHLSRLSMVASIALLLGLTGCATLLASTGSRVFTLSGSRKDPGQEERPVTFEIFHPPGNLWGKIQAKEEGAEGFSGMYVEVKADTKKGSVRPIIELWSSIWKARSWNRGEDPWSSHGGVASAFLSQYEGFLVAVLYDDAGESMRCRFKLRAPERGIKGGAEGTCQTSTGGTITLSSPE
jgi:hypothetical protein